jgi:hypothetical protein
MFVLDIMPVICDLEWLRVIEYHLGGSRPEAQLVPPSGRLRRQTSERDAASDDTCRSTIEV